MEEMMRKTKKIMKKMLVFVVYLICFLIVEIFIGSGFGDMWDKMSKWADK